MIVTMSIVILTTGFHRRWNRLVCVTALLVAVGVAVRVGVPAFRKNVAIAQIARLGGIIETSERGPRWLRRCIGDERMRLFERVQVVQFMDDRISDADMRHVREFPDVEYVSVWSSQITDAG